MFILLPSAANQDVSFYEVGESYQSRRRISYVVCITARCGSTAYCDAMTATGKVGTVNEFFNQREALPKDREIAGTTGYSDHVEYLYERYSSNDGVFGFKTNFWDFHPFIKSGLFRQEFGDTRFIYLYREDVIAQAVSLFRASKSNLWHRRKDGSVIGSDQGGFAVDQYSEVEIANNLKNLLIERANWEIFFAASGVDPLRISYSEIEKDLPAAVNRSLAHLGLSPVNPGSVATAFEKVGDDVSRQMIERFRNTWAMRR